MQELLERTTQVTMSHVNKLEEIEEDDEYLFFCISYFFRNVQYDPTIEGNIITVVGPTWENETIKYCVFRDTRNTESTISNSKIKCKTPPMGVVQNL